MFIKFVPVLIFVCLNINISVLAICPCENPAYCQPIVYNGKEVFAFVEQANSTVWSKFDWTKLTTIALVDFYDPELLCMAHQNNVKVVSLMVYPKEDLLNKDKINQWIGEQIQYTKDRYLDGINIDIEYEIKKDSPYVAALTSFTAQVRDKFHSVFPKSQVSFDVPWSPINEIGTGVDGRNYDYKALANATDFLFIMSYDEQSQIFGTECTAKANSDLYQTAGGILAYLKIGIAASKLVVGVPWYGYDYTCIKTGPQQICFIASVPFRGVNCSDAAGNQLNYVEVTKITDDYGSYYDEHTYNYFSIYNDTKNVTHKMWFDTPLSLSVKFSFADFHKLRGVGVWNANMLDYSGSAESKTMISRMWDTFSDYKSNAPTVGKHYKYKKYPFYTKLFKPFKKFSKY